MCRAIAGDQRRGIIILSARDETGDRVQRLSRRRQLPGQTVRLGELVARIHAVMRRRNPSQSRPVRGGDLSIDPGTRDVTAAGRTVGLSAREFDLLLYLAINAEQVLHSGRFRRGMYGHVQRHHSGRDCSMPTGVYKERLSQSALYEEMPTVTDEEANEVRAMVDQKRHAVPLRPESRDDLTDHQIHQQCKMYVAALRIADDFGCDTIGIQYQQGLKDLAPASDLVEGT